MKISTVIILYNLEKYIDDAIQSALRQTRPSDEIIVVDDCSTDGSADIVAKYRDRVSYIKQQENVGALRNSLAGLKAATAAIVAFLDGDDVWMPEKLEAIEQEFLQDEEVILVSHDFIEVDENLQDLNMLIQCIPHLFRLLALCLLLQDFQFPDQPVMDIRVIPTGQEVVPTQHANVLQAEAGELLYCSFHRWAGGLVLL